MRGRVSNVAGLLVVCGWLMPGARGQVLELNGGASSLYNAQGGGLTLHAANYQAGVSAGLVDGQFVAGGHVDYRTPRSIYQMGVQEMRLNLPTDLFNNGHRLLGLGAGLKTTRDGTTIEAFAGATSTRFDTPMIQGVEPNSPAAVLLLRRPVTSTLTLSSQISMTPTTTALTAIEWRLKPSATLAFSSGLGAGSRYSAASFNLKRPRLDLAMAYIDAGANFRRTGSQLDVTPEPIHANVLFTLRSSQNARFTLSGGRQNMMVSTASLTVPSAVDASGQISTVDQLAASARLEHVGLTVTALHSMYAQQGGLAFAFSAARPVTSRLYVQSAYLEHRLLDGVPESPSRSVVTNVHETLTSRLGANQTISYSNGQTTVGFGGSVLSNLLTITADYQTFYIPTRPANPFQQTLVLDVQVNLFGRATIHAGSFVAPDGHLLYTADFHASESRSGEPAPTVMKSNLGSCMLRGRVVDQDGQPISGAAIEIAGEMLFTDSDGQFFLRERRPTQHPYRILLEQFLDGHAYRVVSKPLEIASSRDVRPPATIVVTRAGAPPAPIVPGTRRALLADDPSGVYGSYVPYTPGQKVSSELKPGDAIPGPRFVNSTATGSQP